MELAARYVHDVSGFDCEGHERTAGSLVAPLSVRARRRRQRRHVKWTVHPDGRDRHSLVPSHCTARTSSDRSACRGLSRPSRSHRHWARRGRQRCAQARGSAGPGLRYADRGHRSKRADDPAPSSPISGPCRQLDGYPARQRRLVTVLRPEPGTRCEGGIGLPGLDRQVTVRPAQARAVRLRDYGCRAGQRVASKNIRRKRRLTLAERATPPTLERASPITWLRAPASRLSISVAITSIAAASAMMAPREARIARLSGSGGFWNPDSMAPIRVSNPVQIPGGGIQLPGDLVRVRRVYRRDRPKECCCSAGGQGPGCTDDEMASSHGLLVLICIHQIPSHESVGCSCFWRTQQWLAHYSTAQSRSDVIVSYQLVPRGSVVQPAACVATVGVCDRPKV